jgi:hypothetical protein
MASSQLITSGALPISTRRQKKSRDFRPRTLSGMYCKDVFKNTICECDCALKRAVAEGCDIHNSEYEIIDIEGRQVPIICSTSAFQGPGGASITGGLETFKDISRNQAAYKKKSSGVRESITGYSKAAMT